MTRVIGCALWLYRILLIPTSMSVAGILYYNLLVDGVLFWYLAVVMCKAQLQAMG
jgi:hypothetical protein